MEVQSQPEAGFVERMFVYHYRLRDRYNRKVVSLAVLGDERASWRPDRYRHELCGCTLEFRFPIVKLIDYSDRMEDLERSSNPFAMLVLVHLKSLETKGDTANRYAWKFRLVKGMYTRGRSAEQVRNLFKFIDWMIDLPPELEKQFTEQLSTMTGGAWMTGESRTTRMAREIDAMQKSEKTVLVAGGGGFIGGHLTKRLLEDGLRVRCVDIRPIDKWEQVFAGAEILLPI